MSEEETTEVVEEEQKETGKGLRAQLEKTLAGSKAKDDTIADLTTRILSGAYEQLNLDPTTGLGKAIAKEYDGDASFDGLAAYAKEEYGYEAPAVDEQHPQAQQIAQGQAALDQVGQTAGSIVPPTQQDALAKAEAEGDHATSMAIKSAQLEGLMKR